MRIAGNRIITHVVLLVSFVSLFTDIASEMLYPIMPVFLQSIGFSVLLIGILEGLAEATAGLSKGYFGQMSDKLTLRVPFIRWGYSLSAVSKPMLAVFTFPLWIFFARTLDRLGKGIRNGARDALLSDEAKPETKGKVFGFHRSMDTIGAAIGPMLALVFLAFHPGEYRWMFILAVVPGAIAVSLTLLLKEKKAKPAVAEKQASGFFSYLGYWKKSSAVYKQLVIGLLAFTIFNSSDAFLLLRLKSQLGSDTLMIGFYIFYNLVYALASYPVGALADKLGLKSVLVAGMTLFAVVYFCMGFASTFLQFGILFLVYALYAAATEGISKALISNIADKQETATAIGFFTSFSSVFALLASSLGGLLWFFISAKVMFIVSGAGVGLTVLYMLTFRIKNKSYLNV